VTSVAALFNLMKKRTDKMAKCNKCGLKISMFSVMRYNTTVDGVKYEICKNCYDESIQKGQKFSYDKVNKRIIVKSEGDVEIRGLCQTCGHIMCISTFDIANNQRLAAQAKMQRTGAMFNALGGNLTASAVQTMGAQNQANQIKDLNRCPQCGSMSIKPLSKEEFEAEKAKRTSTSQPEVKQISSAEELLKFKKLLDDGIITQEEFDAKKKQLLGL
jgi:hypothetical protein